VRMCSTLLRPYGSGCSGLCRPANVGWARTSSRHRSTIAARPRLSSATTSNGKLPHREAMGRRRRCLIDNHAVGFVGRFDQTTLQRSACQSGKHLDRRPAISGTGGNGLASSSDPTLIGYGAIVLSGVTSAESHHRRAGPSRHDGICSYASWPAIRRGRSGTRFPAGRRDRQRAPHGSAAGTDPRPPGQALPASGVIASVLGLLRSVAVSWPSAPNISSACPGTYRTGHGTPKRGRLGSVLNPRRLSRLPSWQ